MRLARVHVRIGQQARPGENICSTLASCGRCQVARSLLEDDVMQREGALGSCQIEVSRNHRDYKRVFPACSVGAWRVRREQSAPERRRTLWAAWKLKPHATIVFATKYAPRPLLSTTCCSRRMGGSNTVTRNSALASATASRLRSRFRSRCRTSKAVCGHSALSVWLSARRARDAGQSLTCHVVARACDQLTFPNEQVVVAEQQFERVPFSPYFTPRICSDVGDSRNHLASTAIVRRISSVSPGKPIRTRLSPRPELGSSKSTPGVMATPASSSSACEGRKRSVGGRWKVSGRSVEDQCKAVEGQWKVGGRPVEGEWKVSGR